MSPVASAGSHSVVGSTARRQSRLAALGDSSSSRARTDGELGIWIARNVNSCVIIVVLHEREGCWWFGGHVDRLQLRERLTRKN